MRPADSVLTGSLTPMQTVLLILHLMIAAALVGVVLLQKSEGGALGIGGGGGGFLTGRGQANLLTRITAGLALAFFVSSISLSLVGHHRVAAGSIFDTTTAPASSPAAPASDAAPGTAAPAADAPAATAPASGEPAAPRGGILDKLK